MTLLYTAHVPAGDGPHATLLALHGWGASAHDLIGLAPMMLGGECLVLCPQGPVTTPIGPNMTGHGWFPLSGGGGFDRDAFKRGADALRAFLAQAEARYPIDARKLAVLGFSQGGVMAYDWFLSEPERFCGLVALSSWLPESLDASLPELPAAKDRPVLVLHGTEDPMIDVTRARESRDVLRRRHLALTYREYAMGHEISREALGELVRWLDVVFAPLVRT